jgi:hypothetical protein
VDGLDADRHIEGTSGARIRQFAYQTTVDFSLDSCGNTSIPACRCGINAAVFRSSPMPYELIPTDYHDFHLRAGWTATTRLPTTRPTFTRDYEEARFENRLGCSYSLGAGTLIEDDWPSTWSGFTANSERSKSLPVPGTRDWATDRIYATASFPL